MKNLLLKISILFLSFQFSVSAQDFDANVKTGCDTLTVKFTYTTPVAVTSVKWTFGDGIESADVSPQHKYTAGGSYLVSLTINGGTPIEKPGFIKIGKTPSADFNTFDTVPYGSYKIGFQAKLQETPPFPYAYSWSFPGGSTETGARIAHQFDTTGVYSVRLIISDLAGCADTLTKSITVLNKLNIPNVFTPNGDGQNDLFIVQGDGTTTFKISIFSRSGVKVFENSAQTLVWDGVMTSGELARDGIFYYVIESVRSTVKLKQTGFFYLFSKPSDTNQ